MHTHFERISITLPKPLLAALNQAVSEEGLSRSEYVRFLLLKQLSFTPREQPVPQRKQLPSRAKKKEKQKRKSDTRQAFVEEDRWAMDTAIKVLVDVAMKRLQRAAPGLSQEALEQAEERLRRFYGICVGVAAQPLRREEGTERPPSRVFE